MKGNASDPRPATAFVTVSLYPNGDVRTYIRELEVERISSIVDALLDTVARLIELRDKPN